MSNTDYHNDTSRISKSGLDLIAKSPAHYYDKYLSGKKSEPTAAMLFGSAFHTYVLEFDKFKKEYAITPYIDRRTKAGKESYNDFLSRNADKTPISPEDYTTIVQMEEKLRENTAIFELFSEKDSAIIEQAFLFSIDGVQCKCKPDYYDSNIIVDLKTTTDASPAEFGKSAYNFRYHVQAAFYMDGIERVTGKRPNGFAFVACEKTEPYLNAVYFITDSDIELGRMTYRKDLAVYRECLKNGNWYGYNYDNGYKIEPLQLPAWAYSKNNTI